METIGLIGGMSWESTIPYYRLINETVHERCGGTAARSRHRLAARHALEVLVPEPADREAAHRIIFEESTQGRVLAASRAEYLRVIGALVARGAQGIVLGCTEISMLIGPDVCAVPVFDTTGLHARSAADYALSG